MVRLVRSTPRSDSEIEWDPSTGKLDSSRLDRFDAVVHLAGEPIATGRWTAQKKALIRDSRVQGTQLLAENLARLNSRPKILVCASAIGIYGNRGAEMLTEQSAPGKGFLARVGQEWEQAASEAARNGIRVVHLRYGIILGIQGGALRMMLPPFKMGLGGRLGSGKQFMSWISIDDAVGAVLHALAVESVQGPVNAVSPNPVINLEFTTTLGKALGRPARFPVPAFAVRLLFGELADEALLASAKVSPVKLAAGGFRWKHPLLEPALKELLA